MAQATLNLSVTEKRMMNASEAASYCGLPMKHFKAVCPVTPLELRPNSLAHDKRDLDAWIDSMKSGAEMITQKAILDRL